MKFKATEDVDAPAHLTWAEFTDFSGIEGEARGRGAELTRIGNWATPSLGAQWGGAVKVRGRTRNVSSKITAFEPENRIEVETVIGGMNAHFELTFTALRDDLTRVQSVMDLSASTLSARLALQTLKLARGRVMQRLQGYLARTGNLAEDAYRRAQE